MSRIEIVLAEFGSYRTNAGDAQLPAERLEPSLSSFLRWFPEASVAVYTDQDWESTDRYRVVKVKPPFEKDHPRYGNRCNDYYGPLGVAESKSDVAISVDSDLLIVNPDVRSIIPLVMHFGLCMPTNGRHIVWRDARSPLDGGAVDDKSRGCGMCHCTAFIACNQNDIRGRSLLSDYAHQVYDDANYKQGARGPLSFWRASWKAMCFPCTLPREWCITGSNLGDAESSGRTVPIILHVGHETVREHYRELVEKYSSARC